MKFIFIGFPFSFISRRSIFAKFYLFKNLSILNFYFCKRKMSEKVLNVAVESKYVLSQKEKLENMAQHFIKSENDKMEYRLIELENGLRAILVSDVLNLVDVNSLQESSDEESEDHRESNNLEDNSEDNSDDNLESSSKNNSDTNSENHSENHSDISSNESEKDASYSYLENDDQVKKNVKEKEEKMAACALCIGVGSFSDPPDIPGLAHFLEHMVFMGSTKYPKENGFDEFIKRHGGSDNGTTDCESTSFYLECGEKFLKQGLDRFAQFFVSPLMKRDSMTRERQIINSEFEMHRQSDTNRREQILSSLAPIDHPARKFQWGNLITLETNVEDDVLYERLHEFRRRHYSANRMAVAVQARLPLDLLEKYVRESFSGIPSNDLPPEDFSQFIGSYGNPDLFHKMIWIKPVKDLCQVNLTWVLPSYLKEYKSRPFDHVGFLVGHEGRGSLLSYLSNNLLALECLVGNCESDFEHNRMYSFFTVQLTLTDKGFKNLNEVIRLVFCYIDMLKKRCPNKAVFDQLKKISEIDFRFKAEIPAADNVEILAESLHLYEPEHYLAGDELYLEYKPELVSEIFSHLTPERVNVIIYSTDKPDSFYDKVEPWFQTKHRIDEIPPEWEKTWYKFTEIKSFHIPLPNPYLVTDFSILPEPETKPPYPEKILDSPLQELWYRQDFTFKKPMAYFAFYIASPALKADPLNIILLDLLIGLIEIKLSEQNFEASQAGLQCGLGMIDVGFGIQCSGYNEKLPFFFAEVLKVIAQYCQEINDESNLDLFNATLKRRYQLYYNNFLKPKKLAKMIRLTLLTDYYSTTVEELEMLKQVTIQKLHDFSIKLFKGVRVYGLIQGNISKEKSLELAEKFESVLHCTPLMEEQPQIKVTKLGVGEHYVRLKSFIEGDSNSIMLNYYQIGQGIKMSCMIDLLMALMEEPLFDSLRTKQQLGYSVHCLLRDTFGVLGFTITVFFQSKKFDPDEVDRRIEKFLKHFLKKLRKMPNKEFEETKESLMSLKSSSDLTLSDEVKRNFPEICSKEYLFDRIQKEVEIISGISQKELCQFFSDNLIPKKNMRKLSIQIIGEADTENGDFENEGKPLHERVYRLKPLPITNDKEAIFIIDIEKFRGTREYFPLKV